MGYLTHPTQRAGINLMPLDKSVPEKTLSLLLKNKTMFTFCCKQRRLNWKSLNFAQQLYLKKIVPFSNDYLCCIYCFQIKSSFHINKSFVSIKVSLSSLEFSKGALCIFFEYKKTYSIDQGNNRSAINVPDKMMGITSYRHLPCHKWSTFMRLACKEVII